MKGQFLVATLHALVTVGVGIYISRQANRAPDVAAFAGYIVGAEILWRMNGAYIAWETAKYAIAVMFALALAKMSRRSTPTAVVIYAALLVPATLISLAEFGFTEARGPLSFNLSGPISLAFSVCFFSNLRLTQSQLTRVFLATALPLVSTAALTAFGTYTIPDLEFGGESNFETSGGFGPNQVSAALGLGAMITLFQSLHGDGETRWRLMFVAMHVALLAQSVMTFSRGGVYGAIGAVVACTPFLAQDSKARARLIPLLLVVVVAVGLVLPALNSFTGGALLERFQDTQMTGRTDLMEEDLNMWRENFVLGVGVGMSKFKHTWGTGGLAAHTEFSRLLAEHGLFGLGAILVLLILFLKNLACTENPSQRAITVVAVVWSSMFMTSNAMRLAAPSYMFGLSCITLVRVVAQRSPAAYERLAPVGSGW